VTYRDYGLQLFFFDSFRLLTIFRVIQRLDFCSGCTTLHVLTKGQYFLSFW
jgi:hypothetical protein